MSILAFKPLYQERVWGGRDLEGKLNRRLPPHKIIGESWEIVDRPREQSVAASGPWAGQTLHDILQKNSALIMGPHWPTHRPFPLIVKWLDCQDRLSLQVHPSPEKATLLRGEAKSENWYIAEASPNTALFAGLRQGISTSQFEEALKTHEIESCVHRFPIREGMSFFVPSGRIHAIDGRCLILEIQDNSDTTYRVYDWDRVGLNGTPRSLHIRESLQCIDFSDVEPSPILASENTQILAECRSFRIRSVPLAATTSLSFNAGEEPRLLSVVNGKLQEESQACSLQRGDTVLLSFSGSSSWKASTKSTVLITDHFCD